MPHLLSIATALPAHRITQDEVLAILTQAKGKALPPRMADLYERTERYSVVANDLAAVQANVRALARRNAA